MAIREKRCFRCGSKMFLRIFFDAKDPPCAWIFRFIKHTLPQSNNNDKHNHYNTTMSDSTLILIGGTGGLGAEVAKGLVTSTAYTEKKALVRSAEKATALKDLGYTLVEFSAYDQPEELVNVLKGAHTIVSTLGGGDMAKLEIAVVEAAQKAGAALFVPSQFGVDYRRWGASFPFLAGKKTVLEAAEKVGLLTFTVFTGYFSDWSKCNNSQP